MNSFSGFFQKHREFLWYTLFGCGTVAINYITYLFCESFLQINYLISIVAAWFLSFLFAFITNKLFVFQSKSFQWLLLLKEFGGFLVCRVFSLGIELVTMFISVGILHWNDKWMKLISNGIVILINYIVKNFFAYIKTYSN